MRILILGAGYAGLTAALRLAQMSLGRRDAIVQLRALDGSVTGPIVTGRGAAHVKEFCRATVWALRFEHWRSQRRGLERALENSASVFGRSARLGR